MPASAPISRLSHRLLGLALGLGATCFSCAHTQSEQPNSAAVARPTQHENDPISQTMDVAVDDKGHINVKKNDRKKVVNPPPAPTEPISNPLDPTAPPPATVQQPIVNP